VAKVGLLLRRGGSCYMVAIERRDVREIRMARENHNERSGGSEEEDKGKE